MAIASTVLILIVFASLEGGLMLYDQALVSAASREAARAGIVLRTPRLSASGIDQVVQCYLGTTICSPKVSEPPSLIGFGSAAVTTKVDPPVTDSIGTRLTVRVTYNYTGLVLYALTPMNRTIEIKGTTTMYME
jgi:Flp pilus assembly protein TadG